MSIVYSGAFTRSAGVISAILKQLKLINLKPVKRIEVQFDPFHPQAITARDFLFHISSPKVLETNYNCLIRPLVVCDRSEPKITVNLGEQGSIKFLASNLTVVEILELINKHVSSKVPVEETAAPVQTKSTKTKVKRK